MFIVRFDPPRAMAFHDAARDRFGDWQADHGAAMDAPAWIPQGSAQARPAGHAPDGQAAFVDAAHILRTRITNPTK